MWFIYAIHNSDKSRIYIGMTQHPDERLQHHNRGKVSSTKAYVPWKRFFLEAVSSSATEARAREKYYKSTTGRRLLKSMIEQG